MNRDELNCILSGHHYNLGDRVILSDTSNNFRNSTLKIGDSGTVVACNCIARVKGFITVRMDKTKSEVHYFKWRFKRV